MNRDRFQDRLDSLGSDLSAWPDSDRIAAERLIASDPEAARAFNEARALDRLIRRSLGRKAPESNQEAFAARILAGLPSKLPRQEGTDRAVPVQAAPKRKRRGLWTFPLLQDALMPRAVALSFAAALGIALGLFWAQKSVPDDRQARIAASEEAATDVTGVMFPTGSEIGLF